MNILFHALVPLFDVANHTPGLHFGTHRFQSTQRGMDPIQPITVPACHFFKKFVAGDSTQDAIHQISAE